MNEMSMPSSESIFAVMMIPIIISIILCIVIVAAEWKMYSKAGQPGWAVFIPIYNIIVLMRIIGRHWTRLFVYLIPLYNIIAIIQDIHRLSKSFGKDAGFTVGLIFLGIIFYPILGFGSAKYVGPNGVAPGGTPAANDRQPAYLQ